MMFKTSLSVRPATEVDKSKLANLVHFELYVHRHLDWRPPLEWVGSEPYLVAEQRGQILAALACPPDPPAVAWIRLFAVSSLLSLERGWRTLWPVALEGLRSMPEVNCAAVIPLQRWLPELLVSSGFERTTQVVMLNWNRGQQIASPVSGKFTIRPMNRDDLWAVAQIDNAAFVPVWQNSKSGLEEAYNQAALAAVAEEDGGLVAYQISTATPLGGHLARLAVLPSVQGQGVGYALVHDLLSQFERRSAQIVTVNTQEDNQASLALYHKAGFRRTGEDYPIYEFNIR